MTEKEWKSLDVGDEIATIGGWVRKIAEATRDGRYYLIKIPSSRSKDGKLAVYIIGDRKKFRLIRKATQRQ